MIDVWYGDIDNRDDGLGDVYWYLKGIYREMYEYRRYVIYKEVCLGEVM